jgi:isopentenyl diphosphate isomerase/L-lactate dehydrogenase-like FMN-dependent dehydrogenase
VVAPTGLTRMMHTEGELAGARAVGRHGIPFCLSTVATTAIEDVHVNGGQSVGSTDSLGCVNGAGAGAVVVGLGAGLGLLLGRGAASILLAV